MQSTPWTLAPYLHVDDAAAAIDWYVEVLGAEVRERHQIHNGRIVHAELDVHGNMLCVADLDTGLPRPDHYDQVAITLYAICLTSIAFSIAPSARARAWTVLSRTRITVSATVVLSIPSDIAGSSARR